MEKDSGIFIRDGGAINVLCPNETKCLELESEAMIRCWYRVRNPEKFCGINLYGQGLLLSSSAMLYMDLRTVHGYIPRDTRSSPLPFLQSRVRCERKSYDQWSVDAGKGSSLGNGSKAQLSTYPGSSLFLHEYTQLLIGLSSPYDERKTSYEEITRGTELYFGMHGFELVSKDQAVMEVNMSLSENHLGAIGHKDCARICETYKYLCNSWTWVSDSATCRFGDRGLDVEINETFDIPSDAIISGFSSTEHFEDIARRECVKAHDNRL